VCVSCECCVLSGRVLCDGLVTCPEEPYRVHWHGLWCMELRCHGLWCMELVTLPWAVVHVVSYVAMDCGAWS
jgi:hypothetical protein